MIENPFTKMSERVAYRRGFTDAVGAAKAAEKLRLMLLRNEDFTGKVSVVEHEDGGPVLLAAYHRWPDSVPPEVYEGFRTTYHVSSGEGELSPMGEQISAHQRRQNILPVPQGEEQT